MADIPAGQKMWVAFADEIQVVTVVGKGTGDRVLKNKVRNPYVVQDDQGDEWVVSLDDLCDSKLCAHRKQLELRQEYELEYEDEDDDDDFDEDD